MKNTSDSHCGLKHTQQEKREKKIRRERIRENSLTHNRRGSSAQEEARHLTCEGIVLIRIPTLTQVTLNIHLLTYLLTYLYDTLNSSFNIHY